MIELILENKKIENNFKADISFKFADCIYNIGKLQDSIDYYEYSLNNYSNDTFVITTKLARVLGKLGKYNQALEQYHKQLDIVKNNESKEEYAELLSLIAPIYTFQCKYKEANEYLEESLEINKHLKNNESIANIFVLIGMNHRYQSNFKEAYDYYVKALDLYKTFFKEDDHRIAEIYQNIGSVLCDQGLYKNSLWFFENSKLVYKKVHDSEDTFFYSILLTNISGALVRLNLNDEALVNSEKSIEIYSKIIKNEDNVKVGDAYKNYGLIYLNKQDYIKSLEYCEKALNIFRKVFVKENDFNLRIGQILNIIGLIYLRMKNCNTAKELFEKCIKIYTKIFQSDQNLNFAEVYDNFGLFYENEKDINKSIEFYKKSLDIKQTVINNNLNIKLINNDKIDNQIIYDEISSITKKFDFLKIND